MPRGKFESHKGRCRQFTPVEVLQRENEREGCKASNSFDDHLNGKCKKMHGAVAGLIEISNPNRPIKRTSKFTSSAESSGTETPPNEERRQERNKDKLRSFLTQKTPIEINADLARLAIVRKKREVAAERRLAAKKDSTTEVQSSKPELSMYKNSNNNNNNKLKPNSEINDKKNNNISENLGKYLKGRNGNKRNLNMHV